MERLLRFSLCGYYGSINPYEVTKPAVRQRILLLINRENLRLEEIAEKLNLSVEEVEGHLEELKKAGLVKEVEDRFSPSFTIFTLKDYAVLEPLINQLSFEIKRVVEGKMGEVKLLVKELEHVKRGLIFPDLDYIIVGAITLDYNGLEFLKQEGLLIVEKEMPGGGRYVFMGSEWPLKIEESWMWGHYETTPKGYWFMTHGKLPPKLPRMAFPDLAWQWIPHIGYEKAIERLEIIGEMLELLLREDLSIKDLSGRTGRGENELIVELSLLWTLDYVTPINGVWRLNRPFFTTDDLAKIREISNLILNEIIKTIKNMMPKLREAYAQTTPFRNEIPLEEAFNYLYHIVFENALNLMIKEGVVAEPPLRLDGGKYSPFIGRREVD